MPCEHGAQAGGTPRGQQGAEDPAGLGRVPEAALVGGSPNALMGSGGGFPNGKWEEARIRVLWALLSLESLSPVWGGRDPHRRPGRRVQPTGSLHLCLWIRPVSWAVGNGGLTF